MERIRLLRNLTIICSVLLMFIGTSCVQSGDLRMTPLPAEETYSVGGKVVLSDLVQFDLLQFSGAYTPGIAKVSDFSIFKAGVGGKSSTVEKTGKFTVLKVPYSEDMLLKVESGKVVLLRRVFPKDLKYSDVTQLTVDLETTAKALIWQAAAEGGKELTQWDIEAREYDNLIQDILTALRLALKMDKSDVPDTVIDLDMVLEPVQTAADAIEAREEVLTEANSVLQNLVLREDQSLLGHYLSPDFGNDWDSTASWQDAMSQTAAYFKTYDITAASYTIAQMEFLASSQARIRTFMDASYVLHPFGTAGTTKTYCSDVIWKKEGSFWKILRNFPYKSTDPTQVGADVRWGEISRAHVRLQQAIFAENLDVLEELISPNFGNDWDYTSTQNDLIETARQRFSYSDVKVSTYTINKIGFIGSDLADVYCSAEVRVIKLAPGIDLDSGPINAVVRWRQENGAWKLFRNLPYRFKHPRNITYTGAIVNPAMGFSGNH